MSIKINEKYAKKFAVLQIHEIVDNTEGYVSPRSRAYLEALENMIMFDPVINAATMQAFALAESSVADDYADHEGWYDRDRGLYKDSEEWEATVDGGRFAILYHLIDNLAKK